MAALTNTGTLYMWGNYKDNEGFLGYSGSQRSEQITPKIYPKTARMWVEEGRGKSRRGEERGERGVIDVFLLLAAITIKQVVSGHNHTIALTNNGRVLIWGFHWLGRRVSERMKRMHLEYTSSPPPLPLFSPLVC